MIKEDDIKWYFENMKLNGLISEGWIYDEFHERENSIIIRYYHLFPRKNKHNKIEFSKKISSYSFPKERVIGELRHAKLKKLLE